MRNYILTSILIFVVLLAVCACKSGNSYSDNIPTDNTVISRITFVANDKNPGIEKASFNIELIGDTGAVVFNKDSLPVGTKIDSVVTRFTFQYAIAGMVLLSPKDTSVLRNNDTIDFTHQPVHIRVISADYTKQRNYRIRVLVHKINPELYQWNLLSDNAFSESGSRQCAVMRNDKFYWLVSSGFNIRLYTSADGVEWASSDVVGLMLQCDVRGLYATDEGFYIASGGTLFKSEDAVNWTMLNDKDYLYILGDYTGGLWCVVRDEQGKLYVDDLRGSLGRYPLPDNFPVTGAAKTAYLSPSMRMQFMAIGGVDVNGNQLNSRWLTQDMQHWVNLTEGQPGYESMEGASLISYGGRLLLIGGLNSDGKLRDRFFLQSFDDGLFWEQLSADDLSLPEQITERAYCNVIPSADGYDLFFMGGMDLSKVYADVWKTRKNSIDWE